jgi:hypothetical protein
MKTESKAEKLICLCNAYKAYIESGAGKESGLELIDALDGYGLTQHSLALKKFILGEFNSFKLSHPWEESICHLSKFPPKEVGHLDIWFDPYEVNFMVRTINPPGYGSAVAGWVSISPVYYWQYHVFQQLIKYEIRDDSFLAVNDLLSSRSFGVEQSDYVSDLYHEEATAYAAWHGKWVSSSIRFESLMHQLSHDQLHSIFAPRLCYWDASFSGTEDSRGVIKCILSDGDRTVERYYSGEWDKSNTIGCLTVISDRIGLVSENVEALDSGECLRLLNSSRDLK